MSVRILHIADIHVRGLQRHDEIRIVFEDILKQARKLNADHIFIAGDAWHTKLQGISPEAIDLFVWMFSSLAEIAELHIMVGNHDMLCSNLSRQDVLSPIINAMNNPKIHYYKYSGVYEFTPGYNFCVFSMFDEHNHDKIKPVPGMVNIACYHGSVYGATTEANWILESDVKTTFFEEYDVAILGDIHKTQFLDFRDVEIIIDESELSNYPMAEVIEVIDE